MTLPRLMIPSLLLSLALPAWAGELSMQLEAWNAQTLPKVERATVWTSLDIDGRPALEARAEAAASGLTRPLAVDAEGTTLQWRWSVSETPPASDLSRKDGDDFAARLYVLFDPPPSHLSFADKAKLAIGRRLFGDGLPRAALCYVWAHREPVGTIAPNAYTDRVRMIVLDQGPGAGLDDWRTHQRDLAADYTAAFGHAPAPRVIGLSLMTDTDNTGASVTARYADLRIVTRP